MLRDTHSRKCRMLTTALGGAFIALISGDPMDPQRPYVPTNMPAVGDLFDMFDFN